MVTHAADDMLLDTSPSTSTPPFVATDGTQIATTSSVPGTPAAASDDVLGAESGDVAMLPTTEPDEAALAAAAAAMAAAAQGHANTLHQQVVAEDGLDSMDDTDDLSFYLVAAAAASVQAQQQLNGNSHGHTHTQSGEIFDSNATSMPDSVYTNGTSVKSSEEEDARAALHEQCRKYTDDLAPFPLTIGKRTPEGCAQALGQCQDAQASAQKLEELPTTEASVELGKTRCYWALLSADYSNGNGPTGKKLQFVYLDPILQQHMAEQTEQLVGSNFYDYVHPEERDRVSDDMQKIVESRTLFGSVTRCRYSRVPRIRELLGAISPPRDPDADRYVEDESFVAIDIVINWIGDGMLLCFFHAIIDKGAEDNDEHHKSDWTNWCGTPAKSFTLRQCDALWKQVKASPREAVPDTGPAHVFQVLEGGDDGRVLLSWPPPRLFLRDVGSSMVAQSDSVVFQDGSYFADDFARLAQGVSIAPGSSSLSDANTSCTRRFRAKHTLTTEGKVCSIESVLIPYGGIILACFHTTFQQQVPPPDPKLVLQAHATLQAQAERRKAEDDSSQPNKRPRIDSGVKPLDSTNSVSEAPQIKAAASSIPPLTPKIQNGLHPEANGTLSQSNGGTSATGHSPKASISKYTKPSTKGEASGLAALANPSLMYTNAPAKASAAPANGTRPAQEHKTAAHSGTNGHSSHKPPPITGDYVNGSTDKACTGCGKVNSPEWRRGPSGHKTLCNACGLRYARSLTRRKKKKGKDGEVEFIEPTGDPSVVPKSRGGGGGSLPGVHRKNSKKRKEEEAARAAASATPSATGAKSGAIRASSAASSSSTSTTTTTTTTLPAAKSASPARISNGMHNLSQETAAAPSVVKTEEGDASIPPSTMSDATAVHADSPGKINASNPAHSIAASIALDAIAQATPSVDTESLSLPVSNAISRAIAATIGSTDGDAGGLLTSQAIASTSDADGALPDVHDATVSGTGAASSGDLDPVVSAAALQTIESVVSEALYKQLVHSSLPETPPADASSADKTDAVLAPSVVEMPLEADSSEHSPAIDLSHALTADAIRAAAQAAIAQGVGSEEPIVSQADS